MVSMLADVMSAMGMLNVVRSGREFFTVLSFMVTVARSAIVLSFLRWSLALGAIIAYHVKGRLAFIV